MQSMGLRRVGTRLSDFTFTFHFHALEKEMATYSSVLAWRIPGTAEPGGLPGGVAESDMTEATQQQQAGPLHLCMHCVQRRHYAVHSAQEHFPYHFIPNIHMTCLLHSVHLFRKVFLITVLKQKPSSFLISFYYYYSTLTTTNYIYTFINLFLIFFYQNKRFLKAANMFVQISVIFPAI